MRRVNRPLWLVVLALAIGIAVATWAGLTGGDGGVRREATPDAASLDTGEVGLRGAGLLAERGRARPEDAPQEVVAPAPAVSMDPPGPDEVSGLVVDPQGRPVVAHLVLFVDGEPPDGEASATTDASGRFRVRPGGSRGARRPDSSPWTGALALWRPHGFTAPLTPARAGQDAVRIVARPAPAARVSVIDEEGKPVARAVVRVGVAIDRVTVAPQRPWLERGDEIAAWLAFERTTDRAGVALARQTPTPASLLRVTAPLDRDLAPATYAGWEGGDATIRLTTKPRVEGTVRESGGGLLSDGKVWWRRSGTEAWQVVRVQYDGTFSIDCGEPGAIELCPRMQNAFTRPPVASRVVPSGTTNVALLTEAGPTLDVLLEGWIDEARGTAELIREPADQADALRVFVKIDDGRVLVRGLDGGARYTLWVPPLTRTSTSPMPVEPETLCALRTGLVASEAPVHVPLTPTQAVGVRLASDFPMGSWRDLRLSARGQGAWLDLQEQAWRMYEDAWWIHLPPGPFRIRVEASQYVSTAADIVEGRILMRPYAGEADGEPGTERVDVPMLPTTDAPVPVSDR